MSKERYSHEFLMYLSSSPLVPKINLEISTLGNTKKNKVVKKDEWDVQDEKFSFESKGMDAIQEFKLMMKSKQAPQPQDDSLQKSRFLKFFDDNTKAQVPKVEAPILQFPKVEKLEDPPLTQEQQQFQRVMAMLARSSVSVPPDQQNQVFPISYQQGFPNNYQSSFPVIQPTDVYKSAEFGSNNVSLGYRPVNHPSFPMAPPIESAMALYPMVSAMPPPLESAMKSCIVPPMVSLGSAPMTGPIATAPVRSLVTAPATNLMTSSTKPLVPLDSPNKNISNIKVQSNSDKSFYSNSKGDASNSLNAMLQSSIKAKKIQTNDNQEWKELHELRDSFNNLLVLVEEDDEFNTTLTRLCLDYFISQNIQDKQTLQRLANLLKNKGDLDHALSLIELQKEKEFEDYRIILECYLIKRPQWVKAADELLSQIKSLKLSDEEKAHLQLIYDIYTDEEHFISCLEKYQESKRIFKSHKWYQFALQNNKRIIDLSNIILQICISKEQYETAWGIFESLAKDSIDSSCLKTMIKIGANAFYSCLLLKKGKHPFGEEEELKWEGRCWAIYAITKESNKLDEKSKGFVIGKILAIVCKSSPAALRSTKICKVYDDALKLGIRITDSLFLPLLDFCKNEIQTKPFSVDVSILYHKINKIYQYQKMNTEKRLFGSSIMNLILQICLLKKDLESFDRICQDLHHLEEYDDDLVANVKKLYGLELINLTEKDSPRIIEEDDFINQDFHLEILKRSLRDSFIIQRENALRGKPTESEAFELLNSEENQVKLKALFEKALRLPKSI